MTTSKARKKSAVTRRGVSLSSAQGRRASGSYRASKSGRIAAKNGIRAARKA